MSLHYQGGGVYNVYFTSSGRAMFMNTDEINELISEVNQHKENEYESPFVIPTSDYLEERIEELEEELEVAEGRLEDLTKICESFIKEVDNAIS